jgi:hypothetical protein
VATKRVNHRIFICFALYTVQSVSPYFLRTLNIGTFSLFVIPAKAGIQYIVYLGSRFLGNDDVKAKPHHRSGLF